MGREERNDPNYMHEVSGNEYTRFPKRRPWYKEFKDKPILKFLLLKWSCPVCLSGPELSLGHSSLGFRMSELSYRECYAWRCFTNTVLAFIFFPFSRKIWSVRDQDRGILCPQINTEELFPKYLISFPLPPLWSRPQHPSSEWLK